MNCTLCPRLCHADRSVGSQEMGFCHAPQEPVVAAVCAHRGEEPPISGGRGICNVFFAYCNLQCVYCQNGQISNSNSFNSPNRLVGIAAIVDRVAQVLPHTENIVGLATPSHFADSIPPLVEALHARDLHPTIVYNTGGYDRVETLRQLEPYVDVYLPDFKYMDSALACRYSHAPDYPQVAVAALREMVRQKGTSLPTDDCDMAFRGVIVRHLVLPGQVENSLAVLDAIAEVSPRLHVSLMAQYYPPVEGLPDQLGRTLRSDEYQQVIDHLQRLGLYRGWLQELSSESFYRPDWSQENPFGY